LNLPAQGRLGHIEAFRGAAEVEFFGNRHETAKLVE
jgi:hypothetical protein